MVKGDTNSAPKENQGKELPVDEAQNDAESNESLSFADLIQTAQEVYNSIATTESALHQLLDSLTA